MIVAAILVIAAAVVLPARAFAKTTLEYEPTNTINPVADNITRLNVNKLEKGSRDYVKGAHMVIIEKETGKVVTEWVTDGSTHEVARNTDDPNRGALNIDTVYILRELEAPAGYAKAEDTEFIIHSDNFNTTGEIKSGDDADSEEIRGSGPEQAFVINLYDEATLETTEERTETRKKDNETGDEDRQSGQSNNSRTVPRNNEYGDSDSNTTSNQVPVSRNNTQSTPNNTTTENEVTQPRSNTRTTSNTHYTYDTDTPSANQYTVSDEYTYDTEYTTSGQNANSANTSPARGGGRLTQTGDETTYLPVVIAGLACLAILVRGYRSRA